MTTKKPPFQPVPSPFGVPGRNDEQATHDAFVEYMGGRNRADRLWNIRKNSYPTQDWRNDTISAVDNFRRKALAEGFSEEEIDALLSL